MSSGLVLVARTPNGDAAFVKRADGTVWLLDPYDSRLSDEGEARQAIRDLDFVEIGSSHADWTEIGRVLAEAAATWRRDRSWPGIESYSVATVSEILDAAAEAGGNQQRLPLPLLKECPAAKDDSVYQRIVALLSPRPATTTWIHPTRYEAARERIGLKLAA